MRFKWNYMVVATKEKNINRKPSPNTGKVAALADGRGECEQIRKNRNRANKIHKNGFHLRTPTCPYRLAGSALPSEVGGS